MKKDKIMLPSKRGASWVFPSVSAVRFATSPSVRKHLPDYVTYSEFQKAMARDAHEAVLPSGDEALRVMRQITIGKDFLCQTWMRKVRFAWRRSLVPKFSFLSESTAERYWWCEVGSAKNWSVCTYILLAVDAQNKLVRYAFFSGGEAGGSSYYIRFHDKRGRETELRYKTVGKLLGGIRKMSQCDDNLICCERSRDEYIQACRNRDGSFYVEYQLYHMPWQMCCRKMSVDDLLRLTKKYSKGGVPAVANEFDWGCCVWPERTTYNLGGALLDRLQKAQKSTGSPRIQETIVALGIKSPIDERFFVPLFVRDGKPSEWSLTIGHMPKNASKLQQAAIRIGAALSGRNFASDAHDVGQLFFKGVGVARDYKLSLYWELRAKRLGSTKAVSAIARLKNYIIG